MNGCYMMTAAASMQFIFWIAFFATCCINLEPINCRPFSPRRRQPMGPSTNIHHQQPMMIDNNRQRHGNDDFGTISIPAKPKSMFYSENTKDHTLLDAGVKVFKIDGFSRGNSELSAKADYGGRNEKVEVSSSDNSRRRNPSTTQHDDDQIDQTSSFLQFEEINRPILMEKYKEMMEQVSDELGMLKKLQEKLKMRMKMNKNKGTTHR